MQIQNLNIMHRASYPWQYIQGRTCFLQLESSEEISSLHILYGDPFHFAPGSLKQPVLRCQIVPCIFQTPLERIYAIAIPMETHKLRYHFEITLCSGEIIFLTEAGTTAPISEAQIRPFFVPYVFEAEHPPAPAWAKDCIWYQIFPDRFYAPGLRQMEPFVPTRENYFCGTLEGIRQKIPYLKELGIQGVYLNPIFSGSSNHRYDTVDYSSVDPMLGSHEDIVRLSNEIHRCGMKLMLDGVFNHCGWEHPIWQDVWENGRASPYYDWFCIYDEKSLCKISFDVFSEKRMQTQPPFEAFAFAANMPKWNTANPEVMEYLITQALKWTKECCVDAWRLDVPDEVHPLFLREFRTQMKKFNPDIYILGEIWQNPTPWISQNLFDGTMDYPLYFAIRDYSLTHQDDLTVFASRISRILASNPFPVRETQWAFCSNHDIPRALRLAGQDDRAVLSAYFLSAVLGGGLSVYYGDEIPMDGGEDPDNRRIMEWAKIDSPYTKQLKSVIFLKRELLSGCKLRSIQVKHGVLWIHMLKDQDAYCAVVPEKDEGVLLKKCWTPIWGNAVSVDEGIQINGPAFLKMKADAEKTPELGASSGQMFSGTV